MLCYCNSKKAYSHCCEPILKGLKLAETAQELMQSRYCAYVNGDIEYILKSHHAETRPSNRRKTILAWTKSVKWLGLEIVLTQNGLVNDNDGFVEFKALFIEDGKMRCIHENSYFVKEMGVWYYKLGTFK